MKKVAVHGSYFANNFGDTLLIRLLCDEATYLVGKEHVYLAIDVDEKERSYIGYPVAPKADLHTFTHLLYSGGGYLGEPPKKLYARIKWSIRNYYRHFFWLDKYQSASISFIGVGVGPISIVPFRKIIKKVMARARIVALRDKESVDYYLTYQLGGPPPIQCVDFALSMKNNIEVVRNSTIALHIGELSLEQIKIVFDVLSSNPELAKCRFEVIFDSGVSISASLRKKYELAAKNIGVSSEVMKFTPYDGVDNLIERLKRYSLVITSKLHVGIVTIALGGKVISIPWHGKTMRLYRQLSLENFCIPRDSFNRLAFKGALERLDDFRPDNAVIENGVKVVRDCIKSALD